MPARTGSGVGRAADRFRFLDFADSAAAGPRDRVLDFRPEEGDQIDLAALVPGRFAFLGTADFTAGGGPQLRYEAGEATTRVEASVAGVGGAAGFVLILDGVLALQEDDFIL
jgi:hypothetical protein